jgi:glycosyltransferase involved in cell wall biosynthesis
VDLLVEFSDPEIAPSRRFFGLLHRLEVMACGVPVVQPRQAGFIEVLEETQGGLLYEGQGVEATVTAWKAALHDPKKLFQLGQQGMRSVDKHFNATRMAKDYLKLIHELCDTSPQSE